MVDLCACVCVWGVRVCACAKTSTQNSFAGTTSAPSTQHPATRWGMQVVTATKARTLVVAVEQERKGEDEHENGVKEHVADLGPSHCLHVRSVVVVRHTIHHDWAGGNNRDHAGRSSRRKHGGGHHAGRWATQVHQHTPVRRLACTRHETRNAKRETRNRRKRESCAKQPSEQANTTT